MRKSKVQNVEVSERELAQAKLDDAQSAHERALAAFKSANAEATEAEEAWEACGDEELEAARERRDAAKKKLAEIIDRNEHGRAGKQLAIAKAHHAKCIEEEKTARLESLKPKLFAFNSELEELTLKWIAIDRQAEKLAAATAEATRSNRAIYEEAKSLSTDLGLAIAEIGPAPDRAEIALLVRKAVAAARRQENAEHRQGVLDQYLRGEVDQWQTAGMSAAERDDLERTAERNRQIARDLELARAHAAGVAVGSAKKEMPS